jgi:hypothetical protein
MLYGSNVLYDFVLGSQSSSPPRLNDDHGGRMCSDGGGIPCSECVSSLLRCCSVSATTPLAPTPTYAFYPSLHHLAPALHAAPPPHFTSSKYFTLSFSLDRDLHQFTLFHRKRDF